MFYALYNKTTNQKLIHPVVGLWNTDKLDDAKALLKSCKEYMNVYNLNHEIIIINAENGEEVG